jgi:hypothetical protein
MRRELTMYGLPSDEEPETPLLTSDLSTRVDHCSQLLYATDYAQAGALLPALLADLRTASAMTSGPERVRIMDMLRETYDNAKRVAYDLGYPDLGLLAASNEEWAAAETGDPLAVATASAVRAWTLTGAGAFEPAYQLLVSTADRLQGESPGRWVVWGWRSTCKPRSPRPGHPTRSVRGSTTQPPNVQRPSLAATATTSGSPSARPTSRSGALAWPSRCTTARPPSPGRRTSG